MCQSDNESKTLPAGTNCHGSDHAHAHELMCSWTNRTISSKRVRAWWTARRAQPMMWNQTQSLVWARQLSWRFPKIGPSLRLTFRPVLIFDKGTVSLSIMQCVLRRDSVQGTILELGRVRQHTCIWQRTPVDLFTSFAGTYSLNRLTPTGVEGVSRFPGPLKLVPDIGPGSRLRLHILTQFNRQWSTFMQSLVDRLSIISVRILLVPSGPIRPANGSTISAGQSGPRLWTSNQLRWESILCRPIQRKRQWPAQIGWTTSHISWYSLSVIIVCVPASGTRSGWLTHTITDERELFSTQYEEKTSQLLELRSD